MSERAYEGSELELFAGATQWKAYWASIVEPFLGERVLDVGAGIGATAGLFSSHACSVWTALEPDPELAGRIAASVASGRLPPHVEARCGTVDDLDQGRRYDTLLYIDVLEHIQDDRAELHRAARLLEPGGHLVIVGPAHGFLYSPFDAAIGHFRRYDLDSLHSVIPPGLQPRIRRYLDAAGMAASLANRWMLRDAEPSPAQIRFWDRLLVPISRRVLDPLTRGRLGKSIACVYRKTSHV